MCFCTYRVPVQRTHACIDGTSGMLNCSKNRPYSNMSQAYSCTHLQQNLSTVLLHSGAKSVREHHALKGSGTRVFLVRKVSETRLIMSILSSQIICCSGNVVVERRIIPLSSLVSRHLSASMLWLAAAICNMSTPWLSTPRISRPRSSRRSKILTAISCFPDGRESYLLHHKRTDVSQSKRQ